ncbi:MAG: AzlC family ABC transporter permease [Deltaproteobacteria bacterium]|jgi:predicted branched-subunit amino acid permease|nr:AzlC family ABC transporter permease [Deltaproteobacteria bacterium]
MPTDAMPTLAGPGPNPPGGWPSLKAGFLAGSPLLLGIVPFGIIYGATARSAGLSIAQSISMSLTVFAGSAQLFFVNLWASRVAVPILILTCLALNLRLLIYGASIGLKLGPPPSGPMALLRSYILTDESYAVTTAALLRPGFKWGKAWFFIGSGLPTWLGWQTTCVMGYLLGSIIPESWPLGLAVPLLFLSLLISILRAGHEKSSPKLVSAAVAGLSAVALAGIPLNLGLLAAIALGVTAGMIHDKTHKPKGARP